MSKYFFTTNWSFSTPVKRVWHAIAHPLEWPLWWKGVERVVELVKGDEDGLGGVHRSTWKSALPYRLTFDSRVVRVERFGIYEVQASGQLEGHGLWSFSVVNGMTHVRYDWNVEANKWWMRFLSHIARPLFRWNHDVIMRWGQQGLTGWLAKNADDVDRVQ